MKNDWILEAKRKVALAEMRFKEQMLLQSLRENEIKVSLNSTKRQLQQTN